MFKSTKLMDVYTKYEYYLRLVKITYWTIAGLISLLTVVNFVYNDSEGESLSGAFFVSLMLIGFLQIIFVPVYLLVKRIAAAVISDNILKPKINLGDTNSFTNIQLPSSSLLKDGDGSAKEDKQALSKQTELITKTVKKFGCDVDFKSHDSGPRLSIFHFKPKVGEMLKDKERLERAIAQVLENDSVRVRVDSNHNGLIHVEVVKQNPRLITLKEVIESDAYSESSALLPIALGTTDTGDFLIPDLRKLPHLLIAGQTGSGKSVVLHNILVSLLMKYSPVNLKILLVDPKMVEFAIYSDIPHLLREIITSPEESTKALEWLVEEMERRFYLLANTQTRNIEEYNAQESEPMPFIIFVVDEFADLMIMDGENTEKIIVKLAQKSRAVGIHMIVSTGRPSVDVYTGLIKANFPARIALTCASKVDSRTVIDTVGAERLLGKGDLLYSDTEMWPSIRAHAALVTDDEVSKITDYYREQSTSH